MMMDYWWVFAVAGLVLAISIVVLLPAWRQRRHEAAIRTGRKTFQRRREWLEARFVTLASESGKPRGLRWVDCDFDNDVSFARERTTGRLRALVGVTIRFEAIEGGGMEDVEAVDNLKAATVVFRLDGPEWEADGRAFFNLNPAQTIEYYQQELETVD